MSRGRKCNPDNFDPPDGVMPDCPEWIKGDALAEWDRIVPQLVERFMVSPVDVATLAAYCKAYASWKKAEQQLEEEGQTFIDNRGNIKVHPLCGVALKYLTEIRQIASEFGFSPSARRKIGAPPPDQQDDTELRAFMGPQQV